MIADYGNVPFSHPAILESEIIGDQQVVGDNMHRTYYFNEERTQLLEEKITDFSPGTYSF